MAVLELNQDPGGNIVLRTQHLRQWLALLALLGAVGLVVAFFMVVIGDRAFNPLELLVIVVGSAYVVGGFVSEALVPYQVVFDQTSRTVTTSRRFLGMSLRTKTASFGEIPIVEYQQYREYRGRGSYDAWSVWVITRDNRHLLINWDGKRDEMGALAQQVAALTGASLLDLSRPVAGGTFELKVNGRDATPAERQEFAQTLRKAIDNPELPRTKRDEAQQILNELTGERKMPKGKAEVVYLETRKGGLPQPPIQKDAQEDAASSMLDSKGAPPVASPWSRPKSPPPADSTPTETPATDGEEKASSEATRSDVTKMTIAELEQRIENDTMDGQARYMLARKYQLRGQPDRAVRLYQEVLNIDPTNADAQNDLGVALEQQRKLKEAEEAYRRAIALDPFSSTAHLNLGLLLRGMNRASEASQEFSQARENARTDVQSRAAEAASTDSKMEPQLSNVFQ